MVKYLTIYGMIEQYYDNEYSVYGDTNQDVYSWKEYLDHDVVLNSHGMYQMPLNISDAVLKGSKNHLDSMVVVQNRYQMRIGFEKIKKDAYTNCYRNESESYCKEYRRDITEISDVTILNEFIEYQSLQMELNSSMTHTIKNANIDNAF